jgi:cell division septation protein DedD
VPAQQLQRWAAETEIQPGAGGARSGGRWRVELARAQSQAEALALYDRLRAAGFPAAIRPLRDGAGYSYVISIGSLADEADALAIAARLKDTPGVGTPRVVRG